MKLTRTQILLLMLGVTFISYFSAEYLFNLFFGFDVPFWGPVGVEPFDFLRSYGIIIGGLTVAITGYILIGRKKK